MDAPVESFYDTFVSRLIEDYVHKNDRVQHQLRFLAARHPPQFEVHGECVLRSLRASVSSCLWWRVTSGEYSPSFQQPHPCWGFSRLWRSAREHQG
jgi:hypothetical protein